MQKRYFSIEVVIFDKNFCQYLLYYGTIGTKIAVDVSFHYL